MRQTFADLDDDALFAEVVRRRARPRADDVGPALGELCERWRRPAYFIIRKIQGSYGRGSPDDDPELFQEAVRKLLDRGLDQYRGISEQVPGKAASPKTFFLRIVKHVTIDRYRQQREELASPSDDADAAEATPAEIAQATRTARRSAERDEAAEIYWAAFDRLRAAHPNEAAAWDVYHHQDVEDHEACARKLGISVANSYKRVSRAQAYLKLYVLDLEGSPSAPHLESGRSPERASTASAKERSRKGERR